MPTPPLQPARLQFGPGGAPYSETYDDIYHSASGGPAQARHVFLAGNGLPQRWQGRERFVVLETGFGLGLNFLATWAAWRNDPQRCQRLHFISVEKHPFAATDFEHAHAAWPEFEALATELRRHWPPLLPGMHRLEFEGGNLVLTLIFGDATEKLRRVEAGVDAFYLDGFAPAKNPEMWTPRLFHALARLAVPGATLATWSVAAAVREGLAAVEFDVEKRQGFTGKRYMLVGHYRSRKPLRHRLAEDRRAIVIGAGLAGSTAAERLAARGWQVTVLERFPAPGRGASGNIAGVLRPHPSIDDNPLARLTRAGFLATRQLLARLGPTVRWQDCGVLHLAQNAGHEAMQRRTAEVLGFPTDYLCFLDREAATARLGRPTEFGGWWFPAGGWVQPHSLCRAALAAWPERITAQLNTFVANIEYRDGEWQALDAGGTTLAKASALIMASGVEARRFLPFADLPQRWARGQTTHLTAAQLAPPKIVVCGQGYLTPAVDGVCSLGASFQIDDTDPAERLFDHEENLARLEQMLPGSAATLDPSTLHGRVGFRPVSPDRLPIVGAMPNHPGLWCALGFGSRGIVWSALMAELLASRMEGEPLPLERDLMDMVAPSRFFPGRNKDFARRNQL
ncbi:MAG: bifunctional tRNA (5-methylaminomethyl-2-thiouridine)(34)-methyltransferase MnmD/FAD-dependent 5-carboxymethylaminomethyl-2-thiouridine(34) oxidoreductase MnmC [Betaproteobacteria bacterium]